MKSFSNLQQTESHQFFSNFDVPPAVKSCVVIPVKNEESHILKTLQSFADQINEKGENVDFETFEILILANNCTDASVSIIKKFQEQNPFIHLFLENIELCAHEANIGFVRRKLMETAFLRLSQNGGGLILTTDADTTVSENWLVQNITEINKGADAVGGRILLCPKELSLLESEDFSHHFKDEKYLLLVADLEAKIMQYSHNPRPTHHQHFNGSFAVTTEYFDKAGGIPHVTHLEDCAFFNNLQKVDAKIRHSMEVIVYTSARYIGRTEIGLSNQLNIWKNSNLNDTVFLVESAESVMERLLLKKNLMKLWQNKNIIKLKFTDEVKKIYPEYTEDENLPLLFSEGLYFGEFYAKFLQTQNECWTKNRRSVPLDRAILDLESLVSNFDIYTFSQTSIR